MAEWWHESQQSNKVGDYFPSACGRRQHLLSRLPWESKHTIMLSHCTPCRWALLVNAKKEAVSITCVNYFSIAVIKHPKEGFFPPLIGWGYSLSWWKAAGTWDSWPHCAHKQKGERDESWPQFTFSLLFWTGKVPPTVGRSSHLS